MDNYRDLDEALIKQLKAKVAAYNKAARKFIGKVESGRARSTETYNELRAALNMPEELSGHKL